MKEADNLTFHAMYSVLQSGMWLLNDLESYLRPLDLSQAQLSILLAITETNDGIISPIEIARITGKSKPAITRSIEKLSDAGIITITSDNTDRRKKILTLTESGQRLLNRIIPEYNSRLAAMSAGFSSVEKQQLIQLLGKIEFLDKDKKLRSF